MWIMVVIAALMGAMWRRWLGEAAPLPRTVVPRDRWWTAFDAFLSAPRWVKIVVGVVAAASLLGLTAGGHDWRWATAAALVVAGMVVPHIGGFGDTGWLDLRNIALRWMPLAVPGAVGLVMVGPWWAAIAYPAAVAVAALGWPLMAALADERHQLTRPIRIAGRPVLGGYTSYAELWSGAWIAGASVALWGWR